MSFAAPLFAWVAGGVALATVALHLLAWRRPPPSPLPTARFAPERPVRLVSRAMRPTDLPLLALRVVLVLLVGLALARPTFARERRGDARVVVVDRSRSGGSGGAVIDSARVTIRSGDALVVFDSAAREVAGSALDSLGAAGTASARSIVRGSISAGLVAAVRAAHRLRRERDSVEIVLVSPVTIDEIDGATAAIRRAWPGPIRLVRPSIPPGDSVLPSRPDVRAPAGDPVAAAVGLVGPTPGGSRVRVVRDAPTAADSAWASAGGTLVVWPLAGQPTTRQSADPSHRDTPDSALSVTAGVGFWGGAGRAGAATVVARMARFAAPPPGSVSARWGDGEPAATDAPLGGGCLRSVAISVPSVGDLALTPSFRRFAERMVEPCAGAPALAPASDRLLATVLPPARSTGSDTSAARRDVLPDSSPGLTAWLLGLALVAAIAEMLVRRGDSHAAA